MLMVKTRIGPSPIHGIGLFADELIPKGTRIWEYREGVDQRFDQGFVESLPAVAQKQILNYSYRNKYTGLYVLCGDDARFFNHSETPNTEDIGYDQVGEGVTTAARDIQPGEELVSNYRNYDATAREGII